MVKHVMISIRVARNKKCSKRHSPLCCFLTRHHVSGNGLGHAWSSVIGGKADRKVRRGGGERGDGRGEFVESLTTTTAEKDRQQLKAERRSQSYYESYADPFPQYRLAAKWRHTLSPPATSSDMVRDFLIKYSFQQRYIGRTVIVNDGRVEDAFKVLNK